MLPSLPPRSRPCPPTWREPPFPHAAQRPSASVSQARRAPARPPVSVTLHLELERGCNDGKGITWGNMGVNGNRPPQLPCRPHVGPARRQYGSQPEFILR